MDKVISKLGIFVRFLIWAKKAATEQVIFISSENHLKKVAYDMQLGKTNIYSKMERKILADIRDLRKKKFIEDINDIEIKELKRTKEFTTFGKLI